MHTLKITEMQDKMLMKLTKLILKQKWMQQKRFKRVKENHLKDKEQRRSLKELIWDKKQATKCQKCFVQTASKDKDDLW